MSTIKAAAAASLKSFIERVERLAQERRDLGDDIRAVLAEAKAEGFDTKAIRAIVKRRDKDAREVAEDEAILDQYMHAIGMIPENPLAAAVGALAGDALARDEVIEAFKKLVPVNGEIIAKVGGEPVRIWRDEAGQSYAEIYIAPKSEKKGRGLKGSATVLSIVPTDPVKAAADAAERRARKKRGEDASDDAETDEPVE